MAGDGLEAVGARELAAPRVGRGVDDGLGQRVLAVALGGGDQAQHLVLVDAVGGRDRDDLGLAAGQRAGLVEDDGVERGGLLERHRVLEQDAALGAQAGADHDRRRRRQPERVRAGDDDDGDREQQRVLDVAADDDVPDDEGQRAADERDEHEPERGAVGEPLAGRLGVLRLLDELDDLRERGVRADGGRAGAQGAVLVDRRADRAGRRASSCTGRLSPVTVDSSTWLSPSSTSASTGDLGARADEQQVADRDLGGRDLDRLAVAQDDGLGRREVEQRADRVVGAAAGAHLEPVAEQHEAWRASRAAS